MEIVGKVPTSGLFAQELHRDTKEEKELLNSVPWAKKVLKVTIKKDGKDNISRRKPCTGLKKR